MSESGPNEFFVPKNLGMTCRNGQKWPFGHLGQSEVSENGPNEFLIPKNLGIDTKNKSQAGSQPKLQVWSCYLMLTKTGHFGYSD